MGVLSDMIERFGGKKSDAREAVKNGGEALDRDGEGRLLYREDIIAMLGAELERRRTERRPFELQWTLNGNFFAGHQYCEINPHHSKVEECPPPYDYMERGVYNRIAPLIETRLANFRSLDYRMSVRAATDEYGDLCKADISTKLLDYACRAGGFSSMWDSLSGWTELCGTAFVLSWWNRDGGAGCGISADGKTALHEGELAYGLLTPYEVYPESAYKESMTAQRSLMTEQVMTADEVFDIYGVRIPGGSVDTYCITPVEGGGGYGYLSTSFSICTRTVENSVRVVTYFERPSRSRPHGRLIIAAGGELLFYGEMPYDEIPVVAVKCKEVPGRFFGRAVIEELIPLQRAYNGCKNKIHDYIQTVAANPLLVPLGCIDNLDGLCDSGMPPASVIEYSPERGKPEPLPAAVLPDEVRLECESLARDMEYVAGVSQLMLVGSAPSGVTSGTAIEKLKSIDSTRMSLTADNMRAAAKKLAGIWLMIMKKMITGCRVLRIVGENEAGGTICFTAEDISLCDVEFDTENTLKYSDEQRRRDFAQAIELGLFADENGRLPTAFRKRAVELLRLGKYGETLDESELQLQNARRENAMLAYGGKPELGAYDDDELHISEHRRFALGAGYRMLMQKDKKSCVLLDAHIAGHEKRMLEKGLKTAEQTEKILTGRSNQNA